MVGIGRAVLELQCIPVPFHIRCVKREVIEVIHQSIVDGTLQRGEGRDRIRPPVNKDAELGLIEPGGHLSLIQGLDDLLLLRCQGIFTCAYDHSQNSQQTKHTHNP